jgi:hypothetical protein
MSNPVRFRLRDWLVPPILIPVFLAMLVVGSILLR